MSSPTHSEGLKIARLFMVLSSVSPLFVLWAIRGSKLIPDLYLTSACAAMIVLPNIFLLNRIRVAKKHQVKKELVVGDAEDHRDHLLVYLFAILLPFYSIDTNSWRDVAALLLAVSFIVFMFWLLNLHYMNIIFAIGGYRVFTITPPRDDNPVSGRISLVLVTPRTSVLSGDRIVAYRLSDTVYFEAKECQANSTLTLQS
jgi:hypothetical protein